MCVYVHVHVPLLKDTSEIQIIILISEVDLYTRVRYWDLRNCPDYSEVSLLREVAYHFIMCRGSFFGMMSAMCPSITGYCSVILALTPRMTEDLARFKPDTSSTGLNLRARVSVRHKRERQRPTS